MFVKTAQNIKNISKVNDYEYSLESEQSLNIFYTVKTDVAICDYEVEKCERFCKHLHIQQKFGGYISQFCPLEIEYY